MNINSLMNPEEPPPRKASTVSPAQQLQSPQQPHSAPPLHPKVPRLSTSSTSSHAPSHIHESPSIIPTISPFRASYDSAVTSSPSVSSPPPKRMSQPSRSPAKRAHSVEDAGVIAHKPKRIKREPTPNWAQVADPSRPPPVPLWQNIPRYNASSVPRTNSVQTVQMTERADGPKPTIQQMPITNGGSLSHGAGPREPSINNVIPHEELTRQIADFCFKEVVLREDYPGVAVEVEAKVGQIIDKNTNDRIRLPVLTETVLSQSDPNLRIVFKSSVTLAQHKFLNDTLNDATKKSMMPSRHKIAYKHRHECDTFYDLSQAALLRLPAPLRQSMNARHNPTLRVTTNQKTGELLAKIVKVRRCDLNVYSPDTLYDYRISINYEYAFEEDYSTFEPSSEGGKPKVRNKDRLSYSHQEYQIDLTQVTPPDSTSVEDKQHELEVELSTTALREQGNLARSGQPSYYEDLVRGFVDNVRTLTRAVKM